MAKQASKAATRKPGGGVGSGASSGASSRTAPEGKKAASAPPAKAAGTRKGAAASSPAKGAKLKVARKAITSGHGNSKSKAGGDGTGASGKKARTAARPVPPKKAKTPASASAQKKPRPVKRVAFDRKTLTGIRKSLEDQRQELIDQLLDIEEAAFSPTQTEASSEAGFDEDYADAGTATFEREKDLSIANNINSLVDKIDKALEKIDQGTYGICENCGQPIAAERLKALPHVLLCINCKKAEERR